MEQATELFDNLLNLINNIAWHEPDYTMFPVIAAVVVIFLLELRKLVHSIRLRNWMTRHPELSAHTRGLIIRSRFWNGQNAPVIRYTVARGLILETNDLFDSHTFLLLPFSKGAMLDVTYCTTNPRLAYLTKYRANAKFTYSRMMILSPIFLTLLVGIEVWLIFVFKT